MKNFFLTLALLVAPTLAAAQIYRCDTPEGPVFSDERCGDGAKIVTITDESSGLGGGPPEEVREYLAQKREERRDEKTGGTGKGGTGKPEFVPPSERRREADLERRIAELEQQRALYPAIPSNYRILDDLGRQIAELRAAQNPPPPEPEPRSEPQVLRLDRSAGN